MASHGKSVNGKGGPRAAAVASLHRKEDNRWQTP